MGRSGHGSEYRRRGPAASGRPAPDGSSLPYDPPSPPAEPFIQRPTPRSDARRARRTVRRLGVGPDRWRWVLLGSMLGHVGVLVLLRALSHPTGTPERLAVAVEVRRVDIADRPSPGAEPPIDPERQRLPSSPERVEVVSAHDREEAPFEYTEREAARDQRRRNADAAVRRQRPGSTDARPDRPEAPGGRPAAAAQDGAPLTVRGGLRPGDDRLARGRRSGGGSPSSGGGPRDGASPEHGGRPRSAGMDGAHQARLLPVPWSPIAVRVRPAGARIAAPQPDVEVGRGLRETRVASVAPAGGTGRAPAPRPASTPRPVPAAPDPVDGARPLRRHEPLGDPVAELREALGWGPLDRTELAPRPDTLGDRQPEGGTTGGGLPAPDADSWVRAVDARGSELGAWAERVDAKVHERWEALDLPMEERARGLQGDVTVRYVVNPAGRVRRVTVIRSSGHPSLDAMAVAAVPARLPRPPAAARPDGLVYEHTLGYRNPLVLVSPR